MSNRPMKSAVLSLLILALGGCASTPMAPPDADAAAKRFEVPTGKSRIYLSRPGTQGALGFVEVVLDGRIVGLLPVKTFLFVDVEPGDHAITWMGVRPFRAEANRAYFFRYRDFGVFRQDTDDDGKAAVAASRLVLLAVQN